MSKAKKPVLAIDEVPRTLSGKALELPVKRILMGHPAEAVTSRDSLANPGSLAWFERYARELESLDTLETDGLVVREGDGSLHVTPLGRLLVRNVAMAFDAYLPEQQRAGARLFSRAV